MCIPNPAIADKDQECDLSETQAAGEGAGVQVDGHQSKVTPADMSKVHLHGQVMSTIKGVGNKPLQHTNSVTTLPSPTKVPKYGVVTTNEEELSLYLDHSRWGINVFRIADLSDSRPLTAVTYTVFHNRGLLDQFMIPPTALLSLLLTLEEHYISDVPYHNSTHAADVTLSMNTLLNSPALEVSPCRGPSPPLVGVHAPGGDDRPVLRGDP